MTAALNVFIDDVQFQGPWVEIDTVPSTLDLNAPDAGALNDLGGALEVTVRAGTDLQGSWSRAETVDGAAFRATRLPIPRRQADRTAAARFELDRRDLRTNFSLLDIEVGDFSWMVRVFDAREVITLPEVVGIELVDPTYRVLVRDFELSESVPAHWRVTEPDPEILSYAFRNFLER